MSENPIRLTRDGAIATFTINRPEKRNAITNEMMEEIERVARAFAQDEKTRAIKTGDGRVVPALSYNNNLPGAS